MKLLNHSYPQRHPQLRSSRRLPRHSYATAGEEALTNSLCDHSMFGVRCSVFDVLSAPLRRFNASTLSPRRSEAKAGQRAFTLIEIMLVVAIIGILAAIVVPKIAGRSEEARVTAAHTDIKSGISTALGAFEVDNGFYPQSLQDLLQKPRNARNWHGPYLDSLPLDPWGNAYLYSYPGKHNSSGYDLWSAGPDGKSGTADDIGNWQTQ